MSSENFSDQKNRENLTFKKKLKTFLNLSRCMVKQTFLLKRTSDHGFTTAVCYYQIQLLTSPAGRPEANPLKTIRFILNFGNSFSTLKSKILGFSVTKCDFGVLGLNVVLSMRLSGLQD